MKLKNALILCAGFGKRLMPLTENIPKALLKVNEITLLENSFNLVNELGISKVLVNTFYLGNKITNFIKNNRYDFEIEVYEDGKEILNTGGGINNLINKSSEENFLVLNPDTLWNKNYINEINEMQNFYFSKKLNNILLLTKKQLSFDKNLGGDFQLNDNLLKKNDNKDFIYIGCQILNKNLFEKYGVKNFPISDIWNELLKKNELNGFESLNKFYHLTDLEIFKKLKDF